MAPARTNKPPAGPTAGSTANRAGAAPAKKEFDFSQFTKYVQQGIDFAKFGVTTAQQFAGARGGASAAPSSSSPLPQAAAAAQPASEPAPVAPAERPVAQDQGAAAPPGGSDQLTLLLQALQQRQIPSLPGSAAPTVTTAPQMTTPAPRLDGLAMLNAILSNPQFQSALQSAAMGAATRHVYLPMPVPAQPVYQQPVPIPLGAVMNAIAQLATRSMSEMTESTDEAASPVPAYLVDEQGEYVVDPANAEDRAALVAHMFRVNAEARRGGEAPAAMVTDDSDAWAREAGFIL